MNAAELLKEKLTEEEYAAFDLALSNAVREKVAEAIAQTKQGTALQPVLMGLLKSWTAWLGGAMIALPELLPLLTPHLESLLGPNVWPKTMQILGILVILARFKTNQSLRDKGMPNA